MAESHNAVPTEPKKNFRYKRMIPNIAIKVEDHALLKFVFERDMKKIFRTRTCIQAPLTPIRLM